MKYAQGTIGRIFTLRLEDGERLPDALESFAAEQNILRGLCILLGGLGSGRMVVGPEDPDILPPNPMIHSLIGAHEVAGVGTLFPDEAGKPVLHMHVSAGRNQSSRTGCIRPGVDVWLVGEAVILEFEGMDEMVRRKNPASGMVLLEGE